MMQDPNQLRTLAETNPSFGKVVEQIQTNGSAEKAVYNELQKRFPNSNINSMIDNMRNIYNSI